MRRSVLGFKCSYRVLCLLFIFREKGWEEVHVCPSLLFLKPAMSKCVAAVPGGSGLSYQTVYSEGGQAPPPSAWGVLILGLAGFGLFPLLSCCDAATFPAQCCHAAPNSFYFNFLWG